MTVVQQAEDLGLTNCVNSISVSQFTYLENGDNCFIPVKGVMTEAVFLLHCSFSSHSCMLLNISAVSPFHVCVNSTFFVP